MKAQSILPTAEIAFLAKLEALERKNLLAIPRTWDEFSDILGLSYVMYYKHVKSLHKKNIIIHEKLFNEHTIVNRIHILKRLENIL